MTGLVALTLLVVGCGGGGGGGSGDSGDDIAVGGGSGLSLPAAAFADPDSIDKFSPVSEGAIVGRFGSRNTPTASYAAHIPEFAEMPPGSGQFIGGQFLDGRASTLVLQAEMPFLNPLEMNMADKAAVVAKLRAADYADDFKNIFGAEAFNNVDSAYRQMATAIATFEGTDVFAPFSSKLDAVMVAKDVFTVSEANGRTLFSDFRYSNIGVPTNPTNPFLNLPPNLNPDGLAFVDKGLGEVLGDPLQDGKFRTPTLRNVADTAPYMHNGVFDTLDEVMVFYNERDLAPVVVPEVAANVDDRGNRGELGLTPAEIQDVIAFLLTLSDN